MSRSPSPPRRWWLLATAALITLSVGVAYYLQLRHGTQGVDLLGYFTIWLAAPLALALICIFAYFQYPARPR